TIGRRLQGVDQRAPCALPLEAAEFVGGHNHHLITAMYGHKLRPLAPRAPHQLAEASFGILKRPARRPTRRLGGRFCNSSHNDQFIPTAILFKIVGRRAQRPWRRWARATRCCMPGGIATTDWLSAWSRSRRFGTMSLVLREIHASHYRSLRSIGFPTE